tara:strand:+ start:20747 stop:21229 length:483 start_codon:yes stop_codon:yes gene_type:complete
MIDANLKKNFLEVMGNISSNVFIISAQNGDTRHAMTATSVASLSAEPPSMLVCVNKDASIHNLIQKEDLFAVNLLSNKQRLLSIACSTQEEGETRFQDEAWTVEDGFIFNSSSIANMLCKCTNIHEHTTHSLVIGEIFKINKNNDHSPLMYLNGSYIIDG